MAQHLVPTPAAALFTASSVFVQQVDWTVFENAVKTPGVLEWFTPENTTADEYSLPHVDGSHYLLVTEPSGNTIGCVAFQPFNDVTYHVHVAFVPGFQADCAAAVNKAKEWIFAHTFAENVCAMIPGDNKRALVLAGLCGMQRAGKLSRAYRRNDEFVDFYIFEVTRWQQLYPR